MHMFPLTQKPDMAARLYAEILKMSEDSVRGTNLALTIQHLAGAIVETCLVFDSPDEVVCAWFHKLSSDLGAAPTPGFMPPAPMPPAHLLDFETERGRAAARAFFVDWLDCAFEFQNLLRVVIAHAIRRWEEDGIPRAAALRMLQDCTYKCLGYELAAQELCDIVIEEKVGQHEWSIGDCIAALSAVAGRRLALSLNADAYAVFAPPELPENLDKIVYVMTQEAYRLGVPIDACWRFGLAANDMPDNAPHDLVQEVEPWCRAFFRAARLGDLYDQAVACAKAAGRMVAVAAGGEFPEMEPAIAKPLAMAAITETYKSVCMTYQIATIN